MNAETIARYYENWTHGRSNTREAGVLYQTLHELRECSRILEPRIGRLVTYWAESTMLSLQGAVTEAVLEKCMQDAEDMEHEPAVLRAMLARSEAQPIAEADKRELILALRRLMRLSKPFEKIIGTPLGLWCRAFIEDLDIFTRAVAKVVAQFEEQV